MKLEIPPPPEERSESADGKDSMLQPTASIYWPSPPFGSYPGPSEHREPLACMVQGSNGEIARARLYAIDFEGRTAELQYAPNRPPIVLRFEQFLSLTLADPMAPAPAGGPPGASRRRGDVRGTPARALPHIAQGFAFDRRQDDRIRRTTRRPVPVSAGRRRDRVIRTFLPKEACLNRNWARRSARCWSSSRP
jgi:hypothetical protein